MKKQFAPFDPFALDEARAKATRSWLIATAMQALFTCVLLGAERFAEKTHYELYARMIVSLGIVTTWSLALRTIRERLLELINVWRKASQGLLSKASESGRHLIAAQLNPAHETYIKGSIRRLRIIAAGLTIPFFVMPLLWTFVSVFLSFKKNSLGAQYWLPIACFMLFSATIVAAYFHWSIVPLPQPARVRAQRHPAWRRRR